MEEIRKYLLSVVVAAVCCGIISSLTKKGSSHGILKLLTGIFLTFTLIRPLARLELKDVTSFLPTFSHKAEEAAADGKIFAWEAAASIIKEESEAYILDKAEALNVSITAEVTLDESDIPAPASVRLCGNVSPYIRQRLQSIIAQDLGIPQEDQIWME